MAHWIVTKGNWTPYGRYKQCLREIAKRRCSLEELQLQREEIQLDLLEIADDSPRARIRARRLKIAARECEQSIGDTVREYEQFCDIAAELKQQVGELTDGRRAKLDEEMWRVRLRAKCATELLCGHRLSEGTVEMILSCPVGFRVALLREVGEAVGDLRNQTKPALIEWVESL